MGSPVTPTFKAVGAGLAHQRPKGLPNMKGIRTSPKKLVPNTDFKAILKQKLTPSLAKLGSLREFAQAVIRRLDVLA